MFKKPSFKFHPRTLVSTLLALIVMAFGSTANAQNNEATQVEVPSEIVDVDISPNTTSSMNSTPNEGTTGLCERPEQWLYAKTYEEGDMASHGGKVWKAVKQTNGDMPGKNTPPFWERVEGHCSESTY
ncbi:MAG: hypothetical protein L0J77_13130 [Marinobacter sp.]|nr:hypothetical protein [Marinobacter sp.]